MILPHAFEDQLSFLDADEVIDLKSALTESPVTSLRVNPAKWAHEVILPKVPWTDHGYYLPERPNFTCDPLLHAGAYYVQEASSMVVGYILKSLLEKLPEQAMVLDLCAAPGGKSTDLAAGLRPGDILLSNEVIQSRARILKETVMKWGAASHWVSSNDPEDFKQLPGMFDLMLIDAPCSGEGLFRKGPEAMKEWSPEAVSHCQKRQQRILADAWDSLAEEGFLIYATCTYNQYENEEVLQWLIDNHEVAPVPMAVAEFGFKVFEQQGFPLYKAFPHQVKGEGFTYFVIQKKELTESVAPKAKRKKDQRKRVSVEKYIKDPQAEGLVVDEVLYYTDDLPTRDLLGERLHMLKSGLRIGEFKKNKLVPEHELALSQLISEHYQSIELTYEQAILYLRKEAFDAPEGDRGFNVVRYKNVNLGFINHLGNRFNSLYPSGLRIHSQQCDSAERNII
ncbi:MAG: RsmF rRNA methyltransferase first C-terminal domain-containing protein [Cytophagales bacterium]|nr:RsmF rRNA methyltransferase first C-terminal domain-containing protein [Cytophagales bacterium]